MRTILRFIALFVCLITLVVWLFGGANAGFTKTSVKVETIDSITEQTIVRWEKRFVAGVDFLGAGFAVGALLFGCSFLFRMKNPDRPAGPQPL